MVLCWEQLCIHFLIVKLSMQSMQPRGILLHQHTKLSSFHWTWNLLQTWTWTGSKWLLFYSQRTCGCFEGPKRGPLYSSDIDKVMFYLPRDNFRHNWPYLGESVCVPSTVFETFLSVGPARKWRDSAADTFRYLGENTLEDAVFTGSINIGIIAAHYLDMFRSIVWIATVFHGFDLSSRCKTMKKWRQWFCFSLVLLLWFTHFVFSKTT